MTNQDIMNQFKKLDYEIKKQSLSDCENALTECAAMYDKILWSTEAQNILDLSNGTNYSILSIKRTRLQAKSDALWMASGIVNKMTINLIKDYKGI